MTYSIVAVDTLTAEVGGAGTSCLGGSDVFVIYRGMPGVGAVHAQARYDAEARDEAARLLQVGRSAPDVLAALTQPAFDADVAVRQYGVVDVSGRAVGFTGSATMPFAADRQGRVSTPAQKAPALRVARVKPVRAVAARASQPTRPHAPVMSRHGSTAPRRGR